jgi:hypothetical protein
MDCYQGNESQKKLMLRIYAIKEFLLSHPIGKSMGLDINSSINSLTTLSSLLEGDLHFNPGH